MAESMPCPRCGKRHEVGKYIPRPELASKPLGDVMPTVSKRHGFDVRSGTPFAPPDVQCECGALLRHTVPLFCVDPYGWHWRTL